ncbi:MAG: alpha/beta hydrolase [Burkholderiales bacterium]|jgi:phospholipase/carboxylesterase|nr:carboxylesterase [Betaproteobacteria bacterium]
MTELIRHLELSTGVEPKGSIVWMHGLGADCWDFVPIVKELALPEDLPLRFIFPQAPSRPISINGGQIMPGWYDISIAELERKADEAGIRESQTAIDALIEHEITRGIAPHNIVLAGFSQGGAIALQCGLRSRHRLGGIMALSTYLTLSDSLGAEKSFANSNIAILMAHGVQDPIVPLSLARTSKATLVSHGFQVEWHEYPMQHAVCGEEIETIAAWLEKRFRSPILLAR